MIFLLGKGNSAPTSFHQPMIPQTILQFLHTILYSLTNIPYILSTLPIFLIFSWPIAILPWNNIMRESNALSQAIPYAVGQLLAPSCGDSQEFQFTFVLGCGKK